MGQTTAHIWLTDKEADQITSGGYMVKPVNDFDFKSMVNILELENLLNQPYKQDKQRREKHGKRI